MITHYTLALSGKSMLRAIFFILTLIIGQTSPLAASLFSSEVVLDSTLPQMEERAKESAFIDVLVRASGQLDLSENTTINKALPRVGEYITRIGYGTVRGKPSLILRFDEKKIRDLLTTAQSYYWGMPRPEVLFWIVEDSQLYRKMLWEQSGSPLIKELKDQGVRRGLPVLTPIGDFTDIVSVSIPDLWGGFVGPIGEASARYKPSGIVVAKLKNNRLTWQFFPSALNIDTDFPIEGVADGSKIEMFTQMIDEISNYYVENFAVNLGVTNDNAKIIEVSGINSADDFFAVERLLKALNTVAALRLDFIEDDKAIFNINLLAPESMFHNELANDRRLNRISLGGSVFIDMPEQDQVSEIETVSGVVNPNNAYEIDPDSVMGGVVIYPDSNNVKIETPVSEKPESGAIELLPDLTPDIRYTWRG